MMRGLSSKRLQQSQVFDRSQMVGVAVMLLWVFAFGMIAISWYGTYVQAAQRHIANPVLASVGYQAICSLAQWGFKSKQNWLLYFFFLAISVVPSIMTYYPLIHGSVALAMVQVKPEVISFAVANIASSLLIVIVLTLNDMGPEWILVR